MLLLDPNVAYLNGFGSLDNTTVLCYAPAQEQAYGVAGYEYVHEYVESEAWDTSFCATLNRTRLLAVAQDESVSSILNLTSSFARPSASHGNVGVNVVDIIDAQSIRPFSQLQYFCHTNAYGEGSLCYALAAPFQRFDSWWYGPWFSVDTEGVSVDIADSCPKWGTVVCTWSTVSIDGKRHTVFPFEHDAGTFWVHYVLVDCLHVRS